MTRFKLARIAAVPLALALLAAAAPAPAPTDQAAANRVRGHVQFLASDELEGRGTGSSGYSVAAAYVAAQFASLGLKPGGTNGGWYLQVPFRRASHSSPPQLSVTAGKEARSLAAGIEFAVEPSLIEKVRSIDAPMVFVGHGIRDSRLGIDDYAGLDVRGKAVVALSGTPPGLATDVAAHLAAMKHEAAAELGAVAVVEIPADASGARARSFGFFLRPRVDWIDSTGRTGRDGRLRARVAMSRPGAERPARAAGARRRRRTRRARRPTAAPGLGRRSRRRRRRTASRSTPATGAAGGGARPTPCARAAPGPRP